MNFFTNIFKICTLEENPTELCKRKKKKKKPREVGNLNPSWTFWNYHADRPLGFQGLSPTAGKHKVGHVYLFLKTQLIAVSFKSQLAPKYGLFNRQSQNMRAK